MMTAAAGRLGRDSCSVSEARVTLTHGPGRMSGGRGSHPGPNVELELERRRFRLGLPTRTESESRLEVGDLTTIRLGTAM